MNIKKTIKDKGFTISKVAELMQVSQPALSKLLDNNPTTNKLREIASVIGCKVGDFFTDEMSNKDFVALIKSGNEFFCASSLQDLQDIVTKLQEKG